MRSFFSLIPLNHKWSGEATRSAEVWLSLRFTGHDHLRRTQNPVALAIALPHYVQHVPLGDVGARLAAERLMFPWIELGAFGRNTLDVVGGQEPTQIAVDQQDTFAPVGLEILGRRAGQRSLKIVQDGQQPLQVGNITLTRLLSALVM